MKILTKAIEKSFLKNPLGSHDGEGDNAKVLLKIFNPYGAGTWLITEASKEGDDWMCFGCAEIGGDWEWGYMSLNELINARVNIMGCRLPFERDMYCKGMTVGELKAA